MAAGKPTKTGSHNSVDYRETTQHHSFAKTNHYPLVIERSYGKLTIKRVIYLLTMVIFSSDVTVYQRMSFSEKLSLQLFVGSVSQVLQLRVSHVMYRGKHGCPINDRTSGPVH